MLLIGLILLLGLSPVIANEEGIVLFSDDVTGIDETVNDDEIANNDPTQEVDNDLSNNDSANKTVEIANSTNNTANDTQETIANDTTSNEPDNYEQFEQHWHSFMSQTSYELYNNSKKTIQQIESEKKFNCYDGAFYTIYLAKHYGMKAEIVHTYWSGVGHGAARVYLPDGSTEIYDTTQYQKGYGRDGANLRWNKIDHYSTNLAREQAEKELGSNPIEKVFNEITDVLFGNKEKENDLSVDLSVDLSTDLSF